IGTVKKTKEGYQLTHIAKKTYAENLLTEGHIVDQDFVAHEIREIVTKNNIKSTIAASALSSYGAIIKKIRLPLSEDMDIEKIMKNPSILEETGLIITEIENSIPFQLKEVYYSYHVLGLDPEDENFINVLFVVSKKEIVDGFIDTFRMAGLKLVLLDLDLISLINIVEQIYGLHGSPVMIVDLGATVMNMAIVKGPYIDLTREVMLGGTYLTEQIQKALKAGYLEAEEKKIKADPEITYLFEDFIFNISSEINKTINFYLSTKPNESISKIFITGGGSLLEGIIDKIYNDTNINIEIIDPFLIVGGEAAVKQNVYKEYREFIPVALHLSTRIDDIVR
ncbi:MAG TPA: type IV pilus assembly protein PilM, partial [Syntrophorhabdaceae bacterium]|nr:type IV pilus assembly protein PilM [Syntrophorhabdaceae bacterium]